MSQGLATASYIIAAVLFILSLAGLSKQETAKYGNWFGIVGMAIALVATIASPSVSGVVYILIAMAIGGAVGARLALKVEMTQMPELVAILHSFVGLAAVLVGFNSFIELLPADAAAQLVLPLSGSPEEILAAAQQAIAQLANQQGGHAGHLEGAIAVAKRHHVELMKSWELGHVITAIFEETAEAQLMQPTFITEYPAAVSPLARRNDQNPEITDRFEFFIGGRELANGFSELNDAEDQAERFQAQVQQKEAGDDEAMFYDADFVTALEHGLPPTAGQGIGIDRLVMLFTNSHTIRDVILFPALRPQK